MNKKVRQVIIDTATLAVFLTVIIVGLGALVYTDSIDLDTNTSSNSTNVTVSDTTCLTYNNDSICYNSENRSEVNLTQLQQLYNQSNS